MKSVRDMNLNGRMPVAQEMLEELRRAQDGPHDPINSGHEGHSVILEELEELWDAVKADRIDHAIEEAIQVGAMAMRFVLDLRHKIGLGESDYAEEDPAFTADMGQCRHGVGLDQDCHDCRQEEE